MLLFQLFNKQGFTSRPKADKLNIKSYETLIYSNYLATADPLVKKYNIMDLNLRT